MKYYFLNAVGVSLTDRNLREIPQPRLELIAHTTLRTTQALAVLASIAGAVTAYRQGQSDCRSLRDTAGSYASVGAVTGAALGPPLALAYLRKFSLDGLYDRAYRLRLNRYQLRVDRLSVVAAVLGAAAACQLGEPVAGGAALGMAGGCVLTGIFNIVTSLF